MPGFDDDILLEVEDRSRSLQRHVEHAGRCGTAATSGTRYARRAPPADMAHTLTPDLGERDLDAAFLAGDPLVLHALVLAAQALVVLDRAKDPGAEQAVPLRLEGPVVDRLGLLDLAEGPRQDPLGAEASEILISSKVRGASTVGRCWSVPGSSPVSSAPHLGPYQGLVRDTPVGKPRPGSGAAALGAALRFRQSSFAVHQLDVEAERTDFLDEDVEALRETPASKLSSPLTMDS